MSALFDARRIKRKAEQSPLGPKPATKMSEFSELAAHFRDHLPKKADYDERSDKSLIEMITLSAEPFVDIPSANIDALLDRIGDCRVVLLGECTHGTSEFYRMRARITQELITRKGFTIIAAEADWPDAAVVNSYIQGRRVSTAAPQGGSFSRFPTWMWANQEFAELVEWLRAHNETFHDPALKAHFYGLDVYSLFNSIHAVIQFLEDKDPELAEHAREMYSCFQDYAGHPQEYGRAAVYEKHKDCEEAVVSMLCEMLNARLRRVSQSSSPTADTGASTSGTVVPSSNNENGGGNGGKTDEEVLWFDAVQNARIIANAERYYKTMYTGYGNGWNIRDSHMFETLQMLLKNKGEGAKAIVWAHNSHIGNAAATSKIGRGQLNLGLLVRQAFDRNSYIIGFGTDHGTVAAASSWSGPMLLKRVLPSRVDSYEHLFHQTGIPKLMLPLRADRTHDVTPVRNSLTPMRLERFIGVIYRPETELRSHYQLASLPLQFDEYIWFDESHAVTPLKPRWQPAPESTEDNPETFPFGE